MTAQIPSDHAPNWSGDLRQFLQVEHNADGTLIRGNPAALLRVVSVAYAATVTPNAATTDILDVGALTGNITLANPTGSPVDGQQLRLVMAQDGTGGRTVTFGTGYVFGTDYPSNLVPTTASAKWEIALGWNAVDGKWRVREIVRIVGGIGLGSQTLTQVLGHGNDGGGSQIVNVAAGVNPSDVAVVSQVPPSTASALLGRVGGTPIQLAKMPPPIAQENWVLTNLVTAFQHATLSPSITGNSTNQTVRTICQLGLLQNQDVHFRLKLNITAAPNVGTFSVGIRPVDNSGNTLSPAVLQYVMQNQNPWTGPYQMDFPDFNWGVAGACFEIVLSCANNVTSGTLSIGSVSVRQIATSQRPIKFGRAGDTGSATLFIPLFNPVTRKFGMVREQMGDDTGSANHDYLYFVDGYSSDLPFGVNVNPADPDFAQASQTASISPNVNCPATIATRTFRINNNDQILVVQKSDLSYEYRGNTHGGESLITTAPPNLIWEADDGSGSWTAWDGTGQYLREYARRFRHTFNTQIARSAPDSDVFATTTHVATYFPDGMMRCDRTTTFVKDTRLQLVFDWMSTLGNPMKGRIGTGLLVLGESDVTEKVATPAAPTATPSASGGHLADATYAYSLTALGPHGETDAATFVTAVVSGGSGLGSVALSWSTVTGAAGYRVYGNQNGAGNQTLMATLGPLATSWTDDGTIAMTGVRPPSKNLSHNNLLTHATLGTASSDKASWAVVYDEAVNMCFGNIYDRDAVAARANVLGVQTRIGTISNSPYPTPKNYINAFFAGDQTPDDGSRLIPAGTVWPVTHWAFAYIPADPVNYHNEIALRAVGLTDLKTMYPAT